MLARKVYEHTNSMTDVRLVMCTVCLNIYISNKFYDFVTAIVLSRHRVGYEEDFLYSNFSAIFIMKVFESFTIC